MVATLHSLVAPPKMRRTSSEAPLRLAYLFRAFAVAIPVSVLGVVVLSPVDELARALGVPSPTEPGLLMRMALTGLALAPVLATSLSLEALRRCALAVHDGQGLTLELARHLRAAGTWMLVSSAGALFVPTLAGLVLSAASGKVTLMVHVGTGVVLPIILAGALRLLGGVVVSAAAMAEDHSRIV
ncbi:hypothetical protein MYSTI_05586 [Myxococcus stipitatus DSM 14675]|uniref:Uncharacterized protein n=1 Tax=Myxococcus stipitatus (strain DSM 14675 / JCM 12634 / Mx s8) TaxID=1278073 RepID=L7UFS1_MYXSD|nr:hypothetical protein [Myxococcus stipitatus]AGC46863.1 hypothetical protein MYSTI_05586 [Myxococcus stipitatus DSM 14675]